MTAPPSPHDFVEAWSARLRERIRERGLRVAEVAALLHVSESSLRKRFRGEVAYSAEEFVLLSDAFDLPRSARALDANLLTLATPDLFLDDFDPARYIGQFTAFARGFGGRSLPDHPIALTLLGTDVSIHQVMQDPVLMAVKLYFFGTRNGARIERRFDLSAALEQWGPLLAEAQAVHRAWQTCDSEEVWGRDPFGSFLHQLSTLARAHAIDADDLATVFERLRRLGDRLAAEAEAGAKEGGGRFALYQNVMFSNNAIVLVRTPEQRYSFLTVANPHFLYSEDAPCYRFLEETIAGLKAQSQRVTRASPLDGRRLGAGFRASIGRAEAAIEAYRKAEAMF